MIGAEELESIARAQAGIADANVVGISDVAQAVGHPVMEMRVVGTPGSWLGIHVPGGIKLSIPAWMMVGAGILVFIATLKFLGRLGTLKPGKSGEPTGYLPSDIEFANEQLGTLPRPLLDAIRWPAAAQAARNKRLKQAPTAPKKGTQPQLADLPAADVDAGEKDPEDEGPGYVKAYTLSNGWSRIEYDSGGWAWMHADNKTIASASSDFGFTLIELAEKEGFM